MVAISGHSIYIGPYGKYVLKSSPLKPVSQFKVNMAWMVLKWSIFKIFKIFKVDHLRTIHAMFALNWLTGFKGEKM
jgi:hypothetical protein